MKQTTLEDLYYGNINPNEISFLWVFVKYVCGVLCHSAVLLYSV